MSQKKYANTLKKLTDMKGFSGKRIEFLSIIFIFIAFITLAYNLSLQEKVLGVVVLALILWSLYPRQHFLSSILIIIILSLFEASLSIDDFLKSLFSTYGGSGFWIIISGFILSEGIEASGLARRLALLIVSSLRGNPYSVILSVALANLVIAPLSPSTTAKAFLLLPVCINLIDVFETEKGKGKYGAAVMLMAMAANNICSTGFLTATVPNPISANYIMDATGIYLGWIEWLRMTFPLTLFLLVVSWFICVLFFKPEVKETPETMERIRFLRRELGPLSRNESLVSLIFSLSLLLVITEKIHGLNAGLISLAISLLLFLPKVGIIRVGGFSREIPWGSITLFAASMFLAKAVGRWQALDPVALGIFRFFNLANFSVIVFTSLVIIISMFIHIAFTSTTVYATVMVPLAISLATLQGVRLQYVSIPLAFLTPLALILPVNTIPNIIFYKAGYFTQKQMIIYGLIVSAISSIIIIVFGLAYWTYSGFI